MILNQSPDNIAIMSNVSDIKEFNMKNSAKAFSILSSGLYSNKIRAIIRELSCNAYDSHVAAGKPTLPFDINLPNIINPYFSIRDYGTGLTHHEVMNIYTTYFESTKTQSNDFVGALGLGSKSPFSYTDNFTITAVKNGIKGIYTAFINDSGIPSIVLMTQEKSNDPAGVEIKFAATNKNDFIKFEQEAAHVFTYFPVKPIIAGSKITIPDIEYVEKDIIPGVHILKNTGYSRNTSSSYAVMGNIKYPIDVPNAEKNLGPLHTLLTMYLELNFEIGELDFQASREGLSYNKQTIDAIKHKLETLHNSLYQKFVNEIITIDNLWDRTFHVMEKLRYSSIWTSSVKQYVNAHPNQLLLDINYGISYRQLILLDEELENKYNIIYKVFKISGNMILKRSKEINRQTKATFSEIAPNSKTIFITSDKPSGYAARVKYHYKTTYDTYDRNKPECVILLCPTDKTTKPDFDGFFKSIYNPSKKSIIDVHSLLMKPSIPKQKKSNAFISIFSLQETSKYYNRTMVWREENKLSALPDSVIYPYVPLNGYTCIDDRISNIKQFENLLFCTGFSKLSNIKVYGVRKPDLENVAQLKNWIPLYDYVASIVNNITKKDLLCTQHNIDIPKLFDISKISDKNSLYLDYCNIPNSTNINKNILDKILIMFNKDLSLKNIDNEATLYYNKLINKYPMLKYINHRDNRKSDYVNDISNYINEIDAKYKEK